jgi:germination protein M
VRRFALLLLSLVVLIAGCGGDETGAPATSAETETTPPATTGETETIAEDVTSFGVYFFRGEKVAPAYRSVSQTEAVGTAALEALLAGPTADETGLGLTSTIPAGTKLLGLDVNEGVASVDLSPEFEAGGGSLSMMGRLAQLTFTLTQFPTIEGVWVAVQGETVHALGGEGVVINEALTRAHFADLTPLILVEHPAVGETVTSPIPVSGTASVFEATLRIRLEGPDGESLWEDTVTASDGAPGRGTFAVAVPFAATGPGRIVAFSPSAKDGSEQHTFEVEIVFAG